MSENNSNNITTCKQSLLALQLWSSQGAVPRTAAAFPLCMAMEMCCRRLFLTEGFSCGHAESSTQLSQKSSAASPSTPDASTAKGTKKWLERQCQCSYSCSGVHTWPVLSSPLVQPQLQLMLQQWESARVHACLGRQAPSHF